MTYQALFSREKNQYHLGPVVQSVVSLTSLLRVISLTVLADSIVIYRVFIYLKHHVYYVSINSFIYYVSKNNFLEQHVYNNMMFTSLILD